MAKKWPITLLTRFWKQIAPPSEGGAIVCTLSVNFSLGYVPCHCNAGSGHYPGKVCRTLSSHQLPIGRTPSCQYPRMYDKCRNRHMSDTFFGFRSYVISYYMQLTSGCHQ